MDSFKCLLYNPVFGYPVLSKIVFSQVVLHRLIPVRIREISRLHGPIINSICSHYLIFKPHIMSCQGQPIPSVFVTKEHDHTYIGNFMKKKYLALCESIGKPETAFIFFPRNDIITLLQEMSAISGAYTMRIYFASYKITGNTQINAIVNAGYADLMTLVFASADKHVNDLGSYFLVSPLGGVINLSKEDATTLIMHFRNFKSPILEEICRHAGRPDFQETRSLSIDLSKFTNPNGVLDEMNCQQASGITAFFGSYDKVQTFVASGTSIGWQMTVIFAWAKSTQIGTNTFNYHFDLEDTVDFGSRNHEAQPPKIIKIEEEIRGYGANTLNPCPPSNINCGI